MATFDITIDHTKVASALTDFPAYIDLSDMPAGFWSTVTSGGGDIRTYQADGTTEIAREVVSCDTTAETGELHIKADLSSTTDTVLVIEADGVSTEPSASSIYGSQNTWNSGYAIVAHSGGGTDSTSHANNGTVTNATDGGVDGNFGSATYYNGSNQYTTIPADASFNDRTALTVSAWAKPDGTAQNVDAFVIDCGTYANYGYAIVTGSRYSNNWGTYYNNSLAINSTTTITDAVWDKITVTYDGTNVKVFVNGVLENTTAKPTDVTTTNFVFRIGCEAKLVERYFKGTIHEVRMSNTPRSADWISAEYNNQSSPSTFYEVTTPIGGNTTNFFRFF